VTEVLNSSGFGNSRLNRFKSCSAHLTSSAHLTTSTGGPSATNPQPQGKLTCREHRLIQRDRMIAEPLEAIFRDQVIVLDPNAANAVNV
jgi:hypothetical protein